MRKEEICVLIDSEEKRLRALEILENAGEKVWNESKLLEKYTRKRYLWNDGEDWIQTGCSFAPQITLDQLEELLLANYVVKDVRVTIDELKEQAEKLGLELVEKKREIKVGDFGVFFSVNEDVLLFDFLLDIEDETFVDSDGNTWKNFRHLTDEEKEKVQNNW